MDRRIFRWVKTGFILSGVGISTLPTLVKAEDIQFIPEIPIFGFLSNVITISSNSIGDYIKVLFVAFIWVVGIIATVMVMYGAVKWVAAAGNAGRIKDARDIIDNAVIGVIIALTSVVLLNIINPSLTKLNGISLSQIGKDVADEYTSKGLRNGSSVSSAQYPAIAAIIQSHKDWQQEIRSVSTGAVPIERILSVIFIESAGNPTAKSSVGALGLMQVMPATGVELGFTEAQLLNGVTNIRAGTKYLNQLAVDTCPAKKEQCTSQPCKNGDWQFIYAAYNGGRTANTCSISCPGQTYSQCTQNPGYAETRDYILKANSAYSWIVSHYSDIMGSTTGPKL